MEPRCIASVQRMVLNQDDVNLEAHSCRVLWGGYPCTNDFVQNKALGNKTFPEPFPVIRNCLMTNQYANRWPILRTIGPDKRDVYLEEWKMFSAFAGAQKWSWTDISIVLSSSSEFLASWCSESLLSWAALPLVSVFELFMFDFIFP